MKILKFEEIIAWQKAQDLAVDLYAIFGDSKDFAFKNQVLRAAVSISNNIAEGFDRGTDPQFVNFLHIAIGSSSEVRSMIHLSEKLGYIDAVQKDTLLEKSNEISRIIRGLIKSIEK